MGKYVFSEVNPIVQRAVGLNYLLRYLNGDTIARMAKETHHSEHYVSKYMRRAAALMVDHAQEVILQEVFPLVVDVVKAHLKQQLKLAAADKPVDLSMVEKVLKGMYVFDSPQLKDNLAHKELGEGEGEPATLEGYIATFKATSPQIPAPAQVKVIDTGKVPEQEKEEEDGD